MSEPLELQSHTFTLSFAGEFGLGLAGQIELGIVRFPDGNRDIYSSVGGGIGAGFSFEGSVTLPVIGSTVGIVYIDPTAPVTQKMLDNIGPSTFYGHGIEGGFSIPLFGFNWGLEFSTPLEAAPLDGVGYGQHLAIDFTAGVGTPGVAIFLTNTQPGLNAIYWAKDFLQDTIGQLISAAEAKFDPTSPVGQVELARLGDLRTKYIDGWQVEGVSLDFESAISVGQLTGIPVVGANTSEILVFDSAGNLAYNTLSAELSSLAGLVPEALAGTAFEHFLPSTLLDASGGLAFDWSTVAFGDVSIALPIHAETWHSACRFDDRRERA